MQYALLYFLVVTDLDLRRRFVMGSVFVSCPIWTQVEPSCAPSGTVAS